jgi:pyruvate formate lyase activating enzyme
VSDAQHAIVYDVQRFSIHDGPGIRTTVFFKGCALACAWCQNPEALRAGPELTYDEARCVEGCARCVDVCPEDALCDRRTGRVDFARCTACGACVEPCPSAALRLVGRPWAAEALLEALLRDRAFHAASGGGVTLSGGEPVLQGGFLRELLPRLKQEGVHVAIETCGAYPFALLEPLLPCIDLVLYDVKVVDPIRHARFTTRDNAQILENLVELVRRGAPLEVRMPVVPGWNTGGRDLEAMAGLLTELGIPALTLLPYNHLWEAKLPRLGTERQPLGIRPPDDAFYHGLQQELARHGIEARL